MKSKSPFNETVIANALVAIFERLGDLERAVAGLAATQTPERLTEAALLAKLETLTIKRHAVLTATLGGLSYADLAGLMACDVTTVKLHLKAVLNILGIKDRSLLLAGSSGLLDGLSDSEYEKRYGLSKCWWLEQKPELMAVLRSTKSAKNQHTPKQAG